MSEQLTIDVGAVRELPTVAETVAEGAERREQVHESATEEWKAEANAVLDRLLAEPARTHVCGNDVWATGLPFPHDKRALGHLFTARARAGRLKKDGTVKSRYGHGSDITLWEVVRG